MTMGDWTPEPWEVQRNGLGQSCGIADSDGRPIGFSCGDFMNKAQPCTNPNATLAAAAPEMAALLGRWLKASAMDARMSAHEVDSLFDDTESVLAKVNGEGDT